MRIWISAAAVVAVCGAGVTVAATQDDPSPTPGTKNSAGCVPSIDGKEATGPDACGPGNYPMSRFHKDADGLIAISCGDDLVRPSGAPAPRSAPVAKGEPDPNCHPMSEADLKAHAEIAKKADEDYAKGRNQGAAPVEEPKQ